MADTGSITGQVLNQRNNLPIPDASLKLTGEGAPTNTSTDKEGHFQFDGLAAGSYDLLVQKEGFEDGLYGPLVVLEGNPTHIVVALEPKTT